MLRVNSKEVLPGDTFLALEGIENDGHNFIEEAIDKGAACIIASKGDYNVKTIIVPDTRTYLSNYLKEMYMERLEKIKIIGLTGTSGKTITGDILEQLLNNIGRKTAYLGTNGFYINGKKEETKSTTPDIYEIYDYINKAIDEECEAIIIEISSRAVIQRHIEGIRFDIVIFTNIILDEENKNQEYIDTKIEIFKMIKKNGYAIINKDDPNYENFVLPQNRNILYGKNEGDYKISNISLTYDYTKFDINGNNIELPLLASYNIYNYLAAYTTARVLNYDEQDINNATRRLKQIDGRYEKIKHKNSLIIIDYAYNPEMIENVINYTKEFCKGRIISIVGAGGGRREDNRPMIGKTVSNLSDYAIITTDNPRFEKPEEIIDDIIKGIEKDNYEVIVSRKEAIKKGIEMLEEGDILLILGRGHEEYQYIGNDPFPLKDFNEVIKHAKPQ